MKRSIAVVLAGFVTTVTIMGATLVAAQSASFTNDTTSTIRNGDIQIFRPSLLPSEPITDTFTNDFDPETERPDLNSPPEFVITDTVNEDTPFRVKLYDAYNKLREAKSGNNIARDRSPVSDTMTNTHYEYEIKLDMNIHVDTDTSIGTRHYKVDDEGFRGLTHTITGTNPEMKEREYDLHVISDTLTHTHHIDDNGEHDWNVHMGDDDHGITRTVGITTGKHDDRGQVNDQRNIDDRSQTNDQKWNSDHGQVNDQRHNEDRTQAKDKSDNGDKQTQGEINHTGVTSGDGNHKQGGGREDRKKP